MFIYTGWESDLTNENGMGWRIHRAIIQGTPSYNEDINSLGEESFTTVGLLEQINLTRDKTDYLWYTTS
jgi:hypothetical protein